MCIFALFVHRHALLAAVGLAAAAAAVGRCAWTEADPSAIFGLRLRSRRGAALTALGVPIGLALGVIYCVRYGLRPFPTTLTWFVVPAVLIGGTEELLYRGYVQGRVRRLGVVGAVAFAAACHTAYKCLLFALPPEPMAVTFWVVALVTFLGGVGFGVMRELSGGVYAPLLAHACFDIIVYGEKAHAPWWVWS